LERLRERIEAGESALQRLEEIIAMANHSAVERDAAIQRFEFTFEALWKAAKEFLWEIEGVENGSPKSVIRSCREVGLFNDGETVAALQMADDRNLTVHTYNEALAIKIFERIKSYTPMLRIWLERMVKKIEECQGDGVVDIPLSGKSYRRV